MAGSRLPTATVRIRDATRAHWPEVLAINRDGAPGVSRLDATELARLAGAAAHFRVAEDAGAVLGYCLAFARADDYDDEEFVWFR